MHCAVCIAHSAGHSRAVSPLLGQAPLTGKRRRRKGEGEEEEKEEKDEEEKENKKKMEKRWK